MVGIIPLTLSQNTSKQPAAPKKTAAAADLEETKNDGQVKLPAATETVFAGVDENMELNEAEQKELMKFETVQTKANEEIEFDKIKITDVRIAFTNKDIAWSQE